jgi:hypothetical protein
MAMGMGEDDLPGHMQLGALRAMAPPDIGLDRAWVWALPAAAMLRSGAAEVGWPAALPLAQRPLPSANAAAPR